MSEETYEAPRVSYPKKDLIRLRDYLTGKVQSELGEFDRNVENFPQVATQKLKDTFAQLSLKLEKDVSEQVLRMAFDEITGYGPIQPLLDDPDVSEVMVNGADRVFAEKKGKVKRTEVTFDSDEHVLKIINKIVLPLGRKIDEDNPTVDARLPDGSRVNAVIPPITIDGPSITVRKFRKEKLTVQDLVNFGSLTENMAEFLKACVVSRLNIVISGGTGSGKTTLLNVLSSFIPEDERVITIEDAAELQLHQEDLVRMETRAHGQSSLREVTIRDLVRNALRMRPDRIVVGECRGGEALDMLQAMNTGHDGSLTTVHSNSPRDATSRLEVLVMMAGMDLPIKVIRQQIASAVDLIVQQTRLRDGSRKVTAITELAGMEGDTIVLTDIFKYEQTGLTEDGKIIGEMKPTGMRPMFSMRLEAAGFKLKPEVFGATVLEVLERNRRR
jgi:pilus assembly protein CpaF